MRRLRVAMARAVVAILAATSGRAATDCPTTHTIGLDPSQANAVRRTFLGHALGQTFVAHDTIIKRVTVWRPGIDVDGVGTKLFVTTVDTLQTPPRPITQGVLREGPIVFIRDNGGALIRMDFVLDPPLVLPWPGTYAVFFQREFCDAGETALLVDTTNSYPGGSHWLTGRAGQSGCYLAAAQSTEDSLDTIFEIEFCDDSETSSQAESWGRVKARYR